MTRVGLKYPFWDKIQLGQIKFKCAVFPGFNTNAFFQFKCIAIFDSNTYFIYFLQIQFTNMINKQTNYQIHALYDFTTHWIKPGFFCVALS